MLPHFTSTDRVLDVGCGTGLRDAIFAPHVRGIVGRTTRVRWSSAPGETAPTPKATYAQADILDLAYCERVRRRHKHAARHQTSSMRTCRSGRS